VLIFTFVGALYAARMAVGDNMGKQKLSAVRKNRTCVLILGMHRSGTSALAGVLNKLGCELPEHTMPPSKNNAKGFFESTVVRDLNDDLLRSTGSSWDDFTAFHEDWLRSPQAGEFLERAVSVLQDEFGKASLFVLKDPRICRLVPFWTEALERFGCTIRRILTVRNPLDVGRSLHAKRSYSEPLSEMIWLRHVLDAERSTRGQPRFHTSFEQLMLGWESVANRAQESLGLIWPKTMANVEFEVTRFLAGHLRHHEQPSSRVAANALLPIWLRKTYEILNTWAEAGETADHYPALDRIRAEFDTASRAFSRVVRGERDASLEPMQRAKELEEAKSNLQAELAATALRSTEQLAAIEMSLREQAELRRSLQEQQELHETALAGLRSQLQAIAADADQQRAEFERAIESQRAELVAVQTAADQRVSEAKTLLQDQRRRNTLLEAELQQAKEAREAIEAELQASRARRKEMARVIARRDAEIQTRYQELATLQREIVRSTLSWKLRQIWRPFRRLL
jgi:hypothetical protein